MTTPGQALLLLQRRCIGGEFLLQHRQLVLEIRLLFQQWRLVLSDLSCFPGRQNGSITNGSSLAVVNPIKHSLDPVIIRLRQRVKLMIMTTTATNG